MFASIALRPLLLLPRLSHVRLCSAASKYPEWALAPPELAEEWVACAISHSECVALNALKGDAPKDGTVLLDDVPASITSDLGLRKPSAIKLTPTHVNLIHNENPAFIPWKFIAKIVKKKKVGAWNIPSDCEDEPELIQGFSETTSRTASLLPVEGGAPTAVLGGFNMHRMKGIDPGIDTANKLSALGGAKAGGLRGRVLDVCTGLGYTCIGAARTPFVDEVVTIELDPLMVEMQRANPWSAELFEHEKITRLLGDATEILPELPEKHFNFVVHDPPANAMSGELYSLAFYTELRRVLTDSGTLFHYVGDPSSKASGKLFKGIIERLRDAGFAGEVKTVQKAYGIVARCGG